MAHATDESEVIIMHFLYILFKPLSLGFSLLQYILGNLMVVIKTFNLSLICIRLAVVTIIMTHSFTIIM